MMNVPNYYQAQTNTQMPTYQQYPQTAYYPQYNYPQQTAYQTVPQMQNYTQPQIQQAQAPVNTAQTQQVPQIDKSRISVQFATEILAECAALVELNKCAVNLEKEIKEAQDPQKKARLQTHAQDLNQIIAQHEQKINQLQAQGKQYEE